MVEQQHLETSPLLLPGLWLVLGYKHTGLLGENLNIETVVTKGKRQTNLLDLVFLHERHKLEEESGQAEQEVDELMDDKRPPGGDLELGVVVQHVAPGMFQGGLEGVFWQHCIHILHRQVGRGQDVCCAVHRHDGQSQEAAGVRREAWGKKNMLLRSVHGVVFISASQVTLADASKVLGTPVIY